MASWEIPGLNGHLHKWENYRNIYMVAFLLPCWINYQKASPPLCPLCPPESRKRRRRPFNKKVPWFNTHNIIYFVPLNMEYMWIAIAPFTAPSQALDCISQLCNLKLSHGRFHLPPKRLESSHIQHNWASLTRSCSTGHAWNPGLPTSFPSNQQWDPMYFQWRVTLMVYQDFHGDYSKVPKSMDK